MNVAGQTNVVTTSKRNVQALTELLVLGSVRAVGGPGPDQSEMLPLVGATSAIGWILAHKVEASLDPLALPPDPDHPLAAEAFAVFRRACTLLTLGGVDDGTINSYRVSAWNLVRAYYAGAMEIPLVESLLRVATPLLQHDEKLATEAVAQAAEVLTVGVNPWVRASIDLQTNGALLRSLYLPYRHAAHIEMTVSAVCGVGSARTALLGGGYAGAMACAALRALTHCTQEILGEQDSPKILEAMKQWCRGSGGPVYPAYLWVVMSFRNEEARAVQKKYVDLWDELGRAISDRVGTLGKSALQRAWREACLRPRDSEPISAMRDSASRVAQEALHICGHRRPSEGAD